MCVWRSGNSCTGSRRAHCCSPPPHGEHHSSTTISHACLCAHTTHERCNTRRRVRWRVSIVSVTEAVAAAADTVSGSTHTSSLIHPSGSVTDKLGPASGHSIRTFTSEKDIIILHDDAGPCENSPWQHTAGTNEGGPPQQLYVHTHTTSPVAHPMQICVFGVGQSFDHKFNTRKHTSQVRELDPHFPRGACLVGAPALLCVAW